MESSLSLRTDVGSQRRITRNKLLWSMARDAYEVSFVECVNGKEAVAADAIMLHIIVYWKSDEKTPSSNAKVCEFSLKLPSVTDGVNWDEVFQTEVGAYRFLFHYHAQPNYISISALEWKGVAI